MEQLDLFSAVLGQYLKGEKGEPIDNERLYARLVDQGVVSEADLQDRQPVGASGARHSVTKRRLRWQQQTLKQLGLIERIPERRGTWRATDKARAELTPAPLRVVMLGFSTELGLAVWGACSDVFSRIDEPVVAAITSPPYPLARPRAYGGPGEAEFADFVCRCLEPIVRNLARGGSVALNIGNEVFQRGVPARSLYKERLVLALHERLGLYKLDEIVWSNPSRPPGPVQWASRQRMLLNAGWEPVLLFTNDPLASLADNRRVLQPHTARHQALVDGGGEQRRTCYGDGAYRIRPGAFGTATAGRVPRNVITMGHRCGDQSRMRAAAAHHGHPPHGAAMPLRLARFLVEYLSRPGDLCVDPFAGSFTTCKAAEELGRRWIGAELMLEYVQAARYRFENAC